MATVRQTVSSRMRVATNLRRLRKAAGLTQVDLSEQMGIPQKTISRLESGRDSFRGDTIDRFAEFFDVDVAELYALPENVSTAA